MRPVGAPAGARAGLALPAALPCGPGRLYLTCRALNDARTSASAARQQGEPSCSYDSSAAVVRVRRCVARDAPAIAQLWADGLLAPGYTDLPPEAAASAAAGGAGGGGAAAEQARQRVSESLNRRLQLKSKVSARSGALLVPN